MVMNATGTLTLAGGTSGQSILYELGGRTTPGPFTSFYNPPATGSYTGQIDLNNAAVRRLANKTSGQISISDVYSQTARFPFVVPAPPGNGYYGPRLYGDITTTPRNRLGYSYYVASASWNEGANATAIDIWSSSSSLPVSGFADSWYIIREDASLTRQITGGYSGNAGTWNYTYPRDGGTVYVIYFNSGNWVPAAGTNCSIIFM